VHNRGQIKWHAFESLYKTSATKNEINDLKIKYNMPILSPDQQEELENLLWQSYYRGDNISLIFYRSNKFYKINDKVIQINSTNKTIKLASGKTLSIAQIVKINSL